MGFYGNITNTSRTQFQFDRIYSSRVEMDDNKFQDGIYAGRYVLIEYDQSADLSLDTFLPVEIFSINEDNTVIVTSSKDQAKPVVTIGDMQKRTNPYAYTSNKPVDSSQGRPNPKDCIFYTWINQEGNAEENAIFRFTIQSENNYTINYKLDTDRYGEGRGYDSTVWQKMYINNMEKYVMIAELNTVVPTFDISSDAPTMNPIIPHFDAGSTDVYYKLHYQPQWGFRVKNIQQEEQVQVLGTEDEPKYVIIKSEDEKEYPSNEKVKYQWTDYNVKTGQAATSEIEYDAAIYYNKDGLKPEIRTYYDGEYEDQISIVPTGYSGNKYNNHDGTNSTSEQVDIQELRILLPAIGNMVSDAWDMIYGYRPSDLVIPNEDGEPPVDEEGNLIVSVKKDTRYRDINWKFVEDTEDLAIGGMTRNVHTFAGCINTIHDLIGMIVTKIKPELINEEEYNKKYIYLTENIITDEEGNEVSKDITYERLLKIPTYKTVDISNFKTAYEEYLNTSYDSTQEKNTAYENLFLTFIADNYYIQNENEEYLFINIKALPEYLDNVIYTDDSYEYKYVEIQGLENHLLTILGALIDCRNLLGTDTPSTTDRTTVQGALNALNAIIDRFKDAIPGQFTFVDEDGKLISMNWTTKQPFSWINYGNNSTGSLEDIENRYIDLSFNFEDGLINLTHTHNLINDTETTSDKNEEEGTGNNKGYGNDLKLYTPIVDNMGHIIGCNIETVTLPYGYKIIKVSNNEETVAPLVGIAENGQIADHTQDTINFDASNRWIKIDNATEDTIKFGHRLTALEAGSPNELYGLEADVSVADLDTDNTFEVPVFRFDEAGHIDFAETHTVKIPENFDKVAVTITPENFQNENKIAGTVDTIEADTITDTLTIEQGNKWILIDGNHENDSLTFSHYVKKFEESSSDTDFNDLDVTKTFSIQELEWDTAGHIISSNKHNFVMPDNIKNVDIKNTGISSIVLGNNNLEGTIIAETLTDTLNIDTGNKWIQLKTDPTNDKFVIYHAPAGNIEDNDINTSFDNSEEPKYGDEFTIPEIKYDDAGHIISVDTHTVKFPIPQMEDWTATGASVLTGISMIDNELNISQTHADVGTLKLTQYVQAPKGDEIEANDTINNAFRKLSQRIQNHEDELDALVGSGDLKEKFDTLVEMSKWLDENDTELADSITAVNTNLNKRIDDEVANRQTEDNTIISSITELNSKVEQYNTTTTSNINTVSKNLEDEINARIATDNAHETNITTNANNIKTLQEILENKYDSATKFNWGYQRVETPGVDIEYQQGNQIFDEEGNPVLDDEGNPTFEQIQIEKSYYTISYEPYQTTLQNILNEILEYHKDLRAKGSDDGTKVYT